MNSIDNAYRNTDQQGIDLVLGLGASGYSCAQFLARQGREFQVADSRLEPPFAHQLRDTLPQTTVSLGQFDLQMLDQVGRVIASPGISSNEPIVQEALRRQLPVISDIELFALSVPAPVIGITGSNGKSTVTTWFSHVLTQAGYECRTGGNLGTPALQLLDAEIPDFYVLELSSFQLERTWNLHLKVGAILNIGVDHLDHHGSVERYREAKWQMLRHCETAVLHRALLDTSEFAMWRATHNTEVVSYGDGPVVSGGDALHYCLEIDKENLRNTWICCDGHRLLPVTALKVVGHHNYINALAVLAMAEACGLTWASMVDGLTSFVGLPHRMQWIGERRGVTWINDSKGTNVDATVAAIQSIATPLVLIAGGDGKGADFAPLASTISGRGAEVRSVVLIGQDAPAIATAIGEACHVGFAETLEMAVALAADTAKTGDTVLLSPACASFDMFDNYMHRGDVFARAWRNLS